MKCRTVLKSVTIFFNMSIPAQRNYILPWTITTAIPQKCCCFFCIKVWIHLTYHIWKSLFQWVMHYTFTIFIFSHNIHTDEIFYIFWRSRGGKRKKVQKVLKVRNIRAKWCPNCGIFALMKHSPWRNGEGKTVLECRLGICLEGFKNDLAHVGTQMLYFELHI